MPVSLPAGNNENAHFNRSVAGWGSDPVGGCLTEIMSKTKYSKHPCIRTHDVGVQADLFLIINKQVSKILKTPRQLLLIVNL